MRRIFKLIGLSLGGVLLAVTALGLVLPRDLRVERKLEVPAPSAAVAVLVDDLSRWQTWAFGPEAATCTFHDASAAALHWTCGEIEGSLLRTDLSPAALWVDAHVGGTVTRVRMKIAITEAPTGTLVTWEEQATAPRVLGAWLRPWLERARSDEIDRSLARLRALLQPDTRQGF